MSTALRDETTAEGRVLELRAPQGFARVVAQLAIAGFWGFVARFLLAEQAHLAAGGETPAWLAIAAEHGLARAALLLLLALAAYGCLASVLQAFGWLVRRDRIVLGSSSWSVSHRFRAGRSEIAYDETGAPESSVIDANFVIWLSDGTAVSVTSLGLSEDRAFVAQALAERARGKADGAPAQGHSRVLGTQRVRRDSDGSLAVHETFAGRFGCVFLLALLGFGILYTNWSGDRGRLLPSGLFLLFAAVVLAWSQRKRGEVRARPGSISVEGRGVFTKGALHVARAGQSDWLIALRVPAESGGEPSFDVPLVTCRGLEAETRAPQIAGWLATASGFPFDGVGKARRPMVGS